MHFKKIIEKIKQGISVHNYHINSEDGLLFFQNKTMDSPKIYLLVALRAVVFDYAHNSIFEAYLSIFKTVHKIQKHFPYPSLKKDIVILCKSCKLCAEFKNSNFTEFGFMHSKIEARHMEKIYIDFCKLTKTNQKTETVLTILKEHIFSHHDIPNCIISDNGAIFRPSHYKNFLSNGINYVFGTSYRPQGNMAERYVANIKKCGMS